MWWIIRWSAIQEDTKDTWNISEDNKWQTVPVFYNCDDLQAGKRAPVSKATTCSSKFYSFFVKFKLIYDALSGADN